MTTQTLSDNLYPLIYRVQGVLEIIKQLQDGTMFEAIQEDEADEKDKHSGIWPTNQSRH